jgi:H+/Cl- antiporter ClcA
MKNTQSIHSLFALPGFVAASQLKGVFGDRYARIMKLRRRKKQPSVRTVDTAAGGVTIDGFCGFVISRLLAGGSTWSSSAGVSIARGAAACM